MADPDFVQRMAAAKTGLKKSRGGRPRIADKHKAEVSKAEAVFAGALEDEAEKYVIELDAKEPEECPHHGFILVCPAPRCGWMSRRRAYNHRAAQYIFDRVMGRPTTRIEQSVTVRLVTQVIEEVIVAFRHANGFDTEQARLEAFSERCYLLSTRWAG